MPHLVSTIISSLPSAAKTIILSFTFQTLDSFCSHGFLWQIRKALRAATAAPPRLPAEPAVVVFTQLHCLFQTKSSLESEAAVARLDCRPGPALPHAFKIRNLKLRELFGRVLSIHTNCYMSAFTVFTGVGLMCTEAQKPV